MKRSRKVWFTIGAPGCGKTTLATTLVTLSLDVATVHLDGIRAALFGSKRAFWDSYDEMRARAVRERYSDQLEWLITKTLFDIVIPNTNLDVSYYNEAKELCDIYGLDFIPIVYDNVTFHELVERNALRAREDQLDIITLQRYWQEFNHADAYWRNIPHWKTSEDKTFTKIYEYQDFDVPANEGAVG